jgi:hypothetical protein
MTAPTNAAATSKKLLPIRRRPHMTQSEQNGEKIQIDTGVIDPEAHV